MKNLRTLCATFVLMLVLTAPAFAGTITTMVTEPPPAPQGDIHTGVTSQESVEDDAAATDSGAEIALNLLQSMFFLF